MKQPFNTKISVFKSLFDSKETPFEQTIIEVFERIKKGNKPLIEKIERIRNAKNKEEADTIKKTLAAICFNGVFRERNKKGLIQHSGVCIVDLDGFEDENVYNEQLEKIKQCKYVLMAFMSPSGKGLKAVIRIPKSTSEEHTRRFNAIKLHLDTPYWDETSKDVSRVCFESYDPDIYLNQFCEEFTEIEEEKGFFYTEKAPSCLVNDDNKKISIITNFKWSKSFVEGQRNAFIFDLASAFCEYGVNQLSAESYILSNYLRSDFAENEILTAIKSSYRTRDFNSKYFEDYETTKLIQKKIIKGETKENILKEHKINIDVLDEIIAENDDSCNIFWEVKYTKQGVVINVISIKYANFLVKNGFMKYYPENSEEPTFVRVIENKVTLSSPEKIKDFVLDYLKKTDNFEVWDYATKSSFLFKSYYLNMIDSVYLKMIQDNRDESFIPYLNGVAKISKNGVELLSYIDVEAFIWENQIIQREFKIKNNYKNDFQDFVHKISGNDPQRILSLETTIGYLIHSFKDKTDQKAIIFNDQEIDDNPNGGSGKSLMLNAISQIRKMVKIDGKAFDPKKSDFVYQRVNLDTQILAFDDVKKYFNFEQLFSLITEGITVNRKNKDEIFIPFERSPKIVITTNYVINGAGNSHERRRHEIEIFQYFNSVITPIKEYGRLLFDSWDDEDWIKFDNYIVYCIQLFLENGLYSSPVINGEKKKLIQTTNIEFYSWAVEDENIVVNKRYYNSEALQSFINDNKQFKDLNTKQFLKWVSELAKYKNAKITKDRDHLGRYFEIENESKEEDSFLF